MKKFTLLVTMLCAINIYAQKPIQGTFTTQVGLSLSNFMPTVNSLGLNSRYFINKGLAARVGASIENFKSTDNFAQNLDGTGSTGTYETKESSKYFNLGIEKHFKGTTKVSPFTSFDFVLSLGKYEEKGNNSNGNSYMKNFTYKETGGYNSLGINLGLGFDYWFTEGLYAGIEYEFVSWAYYKDKDAESDTNGTKKKSLGGTGNAFSTLSALPVIRLGWRIYK